MVGMFARSLMLVVACVCLGSCGWQLQGRAPLSEVAAVTYVDTPDRYTDFNRALRDTLRASGARVVDDPSEATAIVRIREDRSGQRVLAVSARNTPEEYQVFYIVEYSVSDQNSELIEPQRVELTREYSYDQAAVLAKQKEQAILREALARELAALVVRRLGAL